MIYTGPAVRKVTAKPRRRVIYHKPNWAAFYWLGIEAAQHLTPNVSFTEIGKSFGLSKQNARTECMVALGKVVFAMRQLHKRKEGFHKKTAILNHKKNCPGLMHRGRNWSSVSRGLQTWGPIPRDDRNG